jgi:hypothetical protein
LGHDVSGLFRILEKMGFRRLAKRRISSAIFRTDRAASSFRNSIKPIAIISRPVPLQNSASSNVLRLIRLDGAYARIVAKLRRARSQWLPQFDGEMATR